MDGSERRRVVAGVSGSLGSLAALHRAAAEARYRDAELVAVLAWEPPGGELAHRHAVLPSPPVDLRRHASERLTSAVERAFGSAGPGVPYQCLIVRCTPGPALLGIADRADDLLVVGAGCRGRMRRALSPSVARYCLAHAGCAVLAVPPSPLEGDLTSWRRRVSLLLPLDARELTDGRS